MSAMCHAAIAIATVTSPMSHALELPLSAAKPGDAQCMLECHVLGERGLDDGGFLDVQAELGFTWLEGRRSLVPQRRARVSELSS